MEFRLHNMKINDHKWVNKIKKEVKGKRWEQRKGEENNNEITRISAILENGFNHGHDLILSNGSKSLKTLGREELKSTNFPHFHIVRSVISPYKVLSVLAKLRRHSAPVPISELLIMLLKNFLRQRRRRHHHRQLRPEPNRYDRAIGLTPLRKAPEPHRLYVVEVSDHRPGTRARWELESEPLIELVSSEEED